MAKVMLSIPDDLLQRLDRHARAQGVTRSALVQRLAERELAASDAARIARVEEILSQAKDHGGDAAAAIREMRNSR
jgi:metal-responsive CopG/Arc/MetJ family transcriptional regulator